MAESAHLMWACWCRHTSASPSPQMRPPLAQSLLSAPLLSLLHITLRPSVHAPAVASLSHKFVRGIFRLYPVLHTDS